MSLASTEPLPSEFLSDLERKYFWWEPVGSQTRTPHRILAQAMDLASFDEMRRLEETAGLDTLIATMLHAEPGWLSDRSWELWRGRLSFATGRAIPEEPPRRSFDASNP